LSKYGLKAEPIEEGFLNYKTSKVRFIRFGNGEKLLIALHGFGDRANQFLALETALKKDYIVFAIDLPYHGQTQWIGDSFSKKDLLALFDSILKREHKNRFELMGFSFGGRIILASLFDSIKSLDKIYLIAPDGIQTKGIFNALLVPIWFRRLLKRWASKPDFLIKILEKCNKARLLGRFNFNFIKNNIATAKRRDRLFNTWVSLNDFRVDQEEVRNLLKKHAIPVELYFGKNDTIIPLKAGEKLKNGIPNIRLNVIDQGHLLLNEKLNKLIRNQLEVS
jgi:pimeloyl-ACP methyl ester carboxylesterase